MFFIHTHLQAAATSIQHIYLTSVNPKLFLTIVIKEDNPKVFYNVHEIVTQTNCHTTIVVISDIKNKTKIDLTIYIYILFNNYLR